MPRYRVIIHGQNFRLKVEDKWEKMGFYTPRFADAPDHVLAEHTALEDFHQSAKYRQLMEASLNSDEDPSVVTGEDVEEIEPGTEFTEAAGLIFYREAADDGAEPGAPPNRGPADPSGKSDTSGWPPSGS